MSQHHRILMPLGVVALALATVATAQPPSTTRIKTVLPTASDLGEFAPVTSPELYSDEYGETANLLAYRKRDGARLEISIGFLTSERRRPKSDAGMLARTSREPMEIAGTPNNRRIGDSVTQSKPSFRKSGIFKLNSKVGRGAVRLNLDIPPQGRERTRSRPPIPEVSDADVRFMEGLLQTLVDRMVAKGYVVRGQK